MARRSRTPATPSGKPPVGFAELLRDNANFRRLWAGTVISFFGDWFNTIALYRLIEQLTGSPLALGGVFVAKMLPLALASPIAGVLADRLDRRKVMIWTDVLRAALVLGFLLVDRPERVWLLFVLLTAQTTMTAAFNPARDASIPNVTTPRELLTANALIAVTWSTMLAVGAAAGGVAVELIGPRAVFVLDSATYLLSAWFIARARIPQEQVGAEAGLSVVRDGVRKIADGWRRMRLRPEVGRIALAKASWGAGGGALVYLLALLGEAALPAAPAVGIGLLFAARGVGTGIGPILARAFVGDTRRWPALLGLCLFASGLAYLSVGVVPWMVGLVALLVVAAHAASGTIWVLSTVMLQQRAEDQYRGRIFATDWLLVTLTETMSIAVAALLLEFVLPGELRTVILLFAGAQLLTGALWWMLVVPAERARLE